MRGFAASSCAGVAGVSFPAGDARRVFGLLLGKPIGIFACSVLAIRLGIGTLPSPTTYRVLFGSAMLAGIGLRCRFSSPGLLFGMHRSSLRRNRSPGWICLFGTAGSLFLRFVSRKIQWSQCPAMKQFQTVRRIVPISFSSTWWGLPGAQRSFGSHFVSSFVS